MTNVVEAPPKHRVFLSYANADKRLADSLADSLRSRGMDVWDAAERLRIGESVSDQLAHAMEESDTVAFLLSSGAASRPWISHEIALAVATAERKPKRIIPILVTKGVEPPPFLRDLQHLDLSETSPLEVAEVISQLSRSTPRRALWSEENLLARQRAIEAEYVGLLEQRRELIEEQLAKSMRLMAGLAPTGLVLGGLTTLAITIRIVNSAAAAALAFGALSGILVASYALGRSRRVRKAAIDAMKRLDSMRSWSKGDGR